MTSSESERDKDALARLAREAADLHARGAFEDAERRYAALLRADPRQVDALHLLGVLRTQQGHHEEALALIGQAIELNPFFAPAYNSLGGALRGLGRREEALASFDRALALRADFAEAHYNRGAVLGELRQADAAIESCRKAVVLQPGRAAWHFHLAALLSAASRHGEAVSALEKTVALAPGHAQAENNLGAALRVLGRCEEAVAALCRALAAEPGLAEAHTNLGNALRDLGRPEEAIESYRRALALRPDDPDALNNLGLALLALNRLDGARAAFDRGLALQAGHAPLHLGRALALLAAGDLAAGWPEYEWRWRAGAVRARPEFPGPCWNGESLAGRTIALHAEQGYGDTFQFVRYASLVARAAGKTVLQVPASVADLVQGLPGVRVVVQGEPLPRFDFHCPLMSLPRAFGTRLETIPADVPYLRAPAERITKWARRLGGKTARRIGLVWSGRPEQQNDRNRSVGVAGLLPLLEAWGCAFYGLQKAASGPLPGGLTHLGGEFEDFADTAAVISLMDLVISVDTSVAHLAGAMGAPVWLLLPYAADWRWLQDRSDSPWYPTARLFRQARPGDWESVTREVLEALGIR